MLSYTLAQPAYMPRMPETIEELGISASVVTDLLMRRAYVAGTSTMASLSQTLKLSPIIIESIFRELRQQQLVEVKGMVGNDYSFTLTNAGKTMAMERYQITRYCGPAPVSLKQYQRAVKSQSARVRTDRDSLRKSLSDLVLTDSILDRIGPAVISQSSIFLYGATGGGKTSIAERLLRIYGDVIVLPYALEVDGQVIQHYDPVVHERVELFSDDLDPRWLICKRPCVIAGGELVPTMLDLRLDEATGIYAAPLQLKANNGVFVIDDFGRQLMSPRDLLNRWIVPLDRRVDYLMLRYGVKFQIPFEMLVVFATNLDPRELADEAFLRRIQNKVYVEPVDDVCFDEILARVVRARNLKCEPGVAQYMREICVALGSGELRACYPADICQILIAIASYEATTPEVNRDNVYRAANLYFARK